ncbi:reverse transcriptase domain-containing protein, partial [Tanacetum coccineum]
MKRFSYISLVCLHAIKVILWGTEPVPTHLRGDNYDWYQVVYSTSHETVQLEGTISTIVCFFFVIIGWPVIGMVFEKKSIVEEDDKPQGTLRAASEEYLIVNTDATQWNVLQFSRGSTTPFAIKYGSNSHPELVIKADDRVNQKADFSHEGSSTQFGRIKGFKGRVLALEAATNCVRAFVRTRCSRIAPTGRSWAAATTEGVFLYSIDDNFMFDPTCRLWFRSLKKPSSSLDLILPIIAEKVHQEKVQQEKLKVVKACLNFEETSHHSKSGTPTRRRGLKERLGSRHVRSRSGSQEPRCGRSESPKKKGSKRKTMFKRLEKGVFHRLGDKGKSVSVYSDDSRHRSYHSSHRDTKSCHQSSRSRTTEPASERRYNKRALEINQASSRRTDELSESEGSAGGHWKSSVEDDLSQPWVCENTDPFTPRICYFDFPKIRMPSHIKTYDGSEDQEDHLKIFQSAAKTERWAMPTWCHMFNSTLTGNARVWFDDLPKETIDNYDDLKKAFLENYVQQKKCIKDPVEIHNIRQRDGESTEDFVRRYKLECRDVKGAPECMKISGFMHEITNHELIKRLHDKIPKSVDVMMRVTTTFLRGEVTDINKKGQKRSQKDKTKPENGKSVKSQSERSKPKT